MIKCLEHFKGERKIRRMYADRAGEILKACAKLSIAKEPARPGQPRNNAVVERLNQYVLSGARAMLDAAGLPCCFWPFAVECFCLMHNTEEPEGEDQLSPWHITHGEAFGGERLPLGGRVRYYPASTKRGADLKWEGSMKVGIFAGYELVPGYAMLGQETTRCGTLTSSWGCALLRTLRPYRYPCNAHM